jgi:hypothetical protein
MMESLRESTSGTAMYVSTRDSRLGSPPSTINPIQLSTICRNASNYKFGCLFELEVLALDLVVVSLLVLTNRMGWPRSLCL